MAISHGSRAAGGGGPEEPPAGLRKGVLCPQPEGACALGPR